ncbi:hypothetical protein CVT24_002151 [Panaeolus cyanescens]|uniref:Mitochondrial distribution and morphology protein 34 n=1 Tax=Panaeolus cyanescens TaxID=181874 RepID=A0A409YI36_9AGAR|nr:hypothetical protein CVT24_002151 [Panaeolus cyanescens]
MSFTFNWPRFSDQFHYDAIQMLNTALNKGNKPPIIADKIEVVELEMGTQPPELEIRDIGDLTVDQFRGIFRLTYAGDAHLVLKTKVQANPLNHKQPDIHLMSGSRGMLAAKQPLVVPMLLRLSHFKLSSYVVLVVSKQKGITLVFKTDPLQNVDINSTFDSIAVIQNFIQREIEGQLRQMFREDLPGIIHRLSQQWIKAKVEAPYLNKRPGPIPSGQPHSQPASVAGDDVTRPALEIPSMSDVRAFSDIAVQHQPSFTPLQVPYIRNPSLPNPRRARSTTGISTIGKTRLPPSSLRTVSSPLNGSNGLPEKDRDTPPSSHPDLENFDPTYGLRPEGLPTRSVFSGFSSLFTPNKGLADLAEEALSEDDEETSDEGGEIDSEVLDDDEGQSFDIVDWAGPETAFMTSAHGPSTPPHSETEYETIPAVGGGTITRPRVFHSQSAIQLPTGLSGPPHSASGVFRPPLPISRTGSASTLLQANRYPAFPQKPYLSDNAAQKVQPIRSAPSSTAYTHSYSQQHPNTSSSHPGSPESLPSSGRTGVSGPSTSSYSTAPTDRILHDPDERAFHDEAVDIDVDESVSAVGMNKGKQRQLPRYSQQYYSTHTTTYPYPHPYSNPHAGATQRRPSITSSATGAARRHTRDPSFTKDPSASTSSLPTFDGDPSSQPQRDLVIDLTNSIHHLSTLSHSNHTLSPYTRDLSHFTVRSGPRKDSRGVVNSTTAVSSRGTGIARGVMGVGIGIGGGAGSNWEGRRSSGGSGNMTIKAKRKRIYRIGGKKPATVNAEPSGESSNVLRSAGGQAHTPSTQLGIKTKLDEEELDMSDMDRYFRSQDQEPHRTLPTGGKRARSLQHGAQEANLPLRPNPPGVRRGMVYPSGRTTSAS